jgi:hypothetical protein
LANKQIKNFQFFSKTLLKRKKKKTKLQCALRSDF